MFIQILMAIVLFQICLYPYIIPIIQKFDAAQFGISRLVLLIALTFIQAIVLASIANGFKKRVRATEGTNRFRLLMRATGFFLLNFILCSTALSLFLNKWPNFAVWKISETGIAPVLFVQMGFSAILVASAFFFGIIVWGWVAEHELDNKVAYFAKMVKTCKSKVRLYAWLKRVKREKYRQLIVNRITKLVLAQENVERIIKTEFIGYPDPEIKKMLLARAYRVKPKLMQEIAENDEDTQLAGDMASMAGDWKRLHDMFESGLLENNDKNAKMMISALKNNISEENLRLMLASQAVPLTVKKHMINKQKGEICKKLYSDFKDLRMDIVDKIDDQAFLTDIALNGRESTELQIAAAAHVKANPFLYKLLAGSSVREIRVAAAHKIKDNFFYKKIFEHINDAEVLGIIIDRINSTALLKLLEMRDGIIPKKILKKARAKMGKSSHLKARHLKPDLADSSGIQPSDEGQFPHLKTNHLNPNLVDSSGIQPSGSGGDDFQLAIEAMNRSDSVQAEKMFRNAIKKGLDDLRAGYARANIGQLCLKRNDLDETVRMFISALGAGRVLYESAHEAAGYLSEIYLALGRHEEAEGLKRITKKTTAKLGISLDPNVAARIQALVKKQAQKNEADYSDKQKSKADHTNQLLRTSVKELVAECEWHFNNADRYETLKHEFKRREDDIVRPIGKRLHDAGGMKLMRKVYEEVEKIIFHRHQKGCTSALDMKWNRIGEWRG